MTVLLDIALPTTTSHLLLRHPTGQHLRCPVLPTCPTAAMRLVDVPREQVTPREPVRTELARIRLIARVGPHMSSDMLLSSERDVADLAFERSSHDCKGFRLISQCEVA